MIGVFCEILNNEFNGKVCGKIAPVPFVDKSWMSDVVILKAGKHPFCENTPVPRQFVIRLYEVGGDFLIAGQFRPVPFKILAFTYSRFVLQFF